MKKPVKRIFTWYFFRSGPSLHYHNDNQVFIRNQTDGTCGDAGHKRHCILHT